MRVKIGPYRGDLISIRQLERAYTGWRHDKYYQNEEDYDRIDKLVYGFLDWADDLLRPINRWNSNRPRQVKTHIDNYDVWSADHTFALIIVPTLKKLKEIQHGYPYVDNDDVPEDLRISDEDQAKVGSGDVDDKHEARWNYILDEMIWAFEQHAAPDDNDDQFHHNTEQLEILFKPFDDHKDWKTIDFNHQKDPSKPAYWVDHEGKKKHHERIDNGLRLFAKYYRSLWD